LKICVIGAGYVGLVSAAGFASLGQGVVCVDRHPEKVGLVNSKKSPIFEDGLDGLLSKVVPGKLTATTDVSSALEGSDAVFICVGTPSLQDGSADLSLVLAASETVGKNISRMAAYPVVVVKSTVPPCSTVGAVIPVLKRASGKEPGKDFGVAMAPEFLREGMALKDFLHPDRIVCGADCEKTKARLSPLFSKFSCPVLWTSGISSAEMVKYASNSFLAAKISFINEIGNYCKAIGVDTYEVADGMGLDRRIGRAFLNSGCGFGGSCFPKDVSALKQLMNKGGFPTAILDAILEVNSRQPLKMISILEKKIGNLSGKKIAVLGLAFKSGTDDVRDSPAFVAVDALQKGGAKIIAFDPEGMENFSKKVATIEYAPTGQEAVDNSDAVLLVTDWPQFEKLEYGDKIVIDGKSVLSREKRAKVGNYEGLCW
jgi:UDPglucose 6-dehydrogenase